MNYMRIMWRAFLHYIISTIEDGVNIMANGNGTQILTESDLARINTALEQLKRADEVIDMASRAGIDVAQFQTRAKDSKDQLLRIKNTFFPGR